MATATPASASTSSTLDAAPDAAQQAGPPPNPSPAPPGVPWLAALKQVTGHAAATPPEPSAAVSPTGSDADDVHDHSGRDASPAGSPSPQPPVGGTADEPPAAEPSSSDKKSASKSRTAAKKPAARSRKNTPRPSRARSSLGDEDLDDFDPDNPDVVGSGGRKAQNRIAQREFRQRKQEYIKALETSVEQLAVEQNDEVMHLRYMLHQLMLENNQIRDSVSTLGTFAGGLHNILGNGFSEAEMSDIDTLLGSTSERTVTRAWHTWPGKTPSALLQKLRAQCDLPPEGLPESADRLIARYAPEANPPLARPASTEASHSGDNDPARKGTDKMTSPRSKRPRTSDGHSAKPDAAGQDSPHSQDKSQSLTTPSTDDPAKILPHDPASATSSADQPAPQRSPKSLAIDTSSSSKEGGPNESLPSAPSGHGSGAPYSSGATQNSPSSLGSAPTFYPPINLPRAPTALPPSGGEDPLASSNESGMDLLMQFLRASGQQIPSSLPAPAQTNVPPPGPSAIPTLPSSSTAPQNSSEFGGLSNGFPRSASGELPTPGGLNDTGSPGDVFNSVSVLAALYDPAYPWSSMPLPNNRPNAPSSFMNVGAGEGPPNTAPFYHQGGGFPQGPTAAASSSAGPSPGRPLWGGLGGYDLGNNSVPYPFQPPWMPGSNVGLAGGGPIGPSELGGPPSWRNQTAGPPQNFPASSAYPPPHLWGAPAWRAPGQTALSPGVSDPSVAEKNASMERPESRD